MLNGRAAVLDLTDEAGTGPLAFTLSWGDGASCVWLGETGRQGWVQLERSYQPASQPQEPVDPSALEDLVIELLEPVTEENDD